MRSFFNNNFNITSFKLGNIGSIPSINNNSYIGKLHNIKYTGNDIQ